MGLPSPAPDAASPINASCVYYNEKCETFGSRFQFCFDADSLRSKNAY